MQFLKSLGFGRTEAFVAAGVFVVGLLALALAGGFTQPAPVEPTATALKPIISTLTPLPVTATLPATAAPTVTPLPTETPAPVIIPPTPTWFYIAPNTLDLPPTPVLPAVAPFPTACDGPGRINILLIGIDGFDANYNRPARTDTVILVGVNFSNKTAQMVAFPRDLWLPLPGGLPVTEARINSAYHYGELYGVAGGGPAQLRATLEQNFGVRVDRHMVVSFMAFEQGVDTIGGIEIDVPKPIRDPAYPMRSREGVMAIEFPAGRVQMDGGTALIYARIRHDSSDFQRMRRQQQVLFAVRDKLLQPETIPQWPALAQLLFSSVRTDLSFDDVALLGCAGAQIGSGAISSTVIDSRMVTPTTLADGAQILMPQMEGILPVLQAFNAGE
jgi:LCP family protein required for cell wall assembly